jgi:hypothetical protein
MLNNIINHNMNDHKVTNSKLISVIKNHKFSKRFDNDFTS